MNIDMTNENNLFVGEILGNKRNACEEKSFEDIKEEWYEALLGNNYNNKVVYGEILVKEEIKEEYLEDLSPLCDVNEERINSQDENSMPNDFTKSVIHSHLPEKDDCEESSANKIKEVFSDSYDGNGFSDQEPGVSGCYEIITEDGSLKEEMFGEILMKEEIKEEYLEDFSPISDRNEEGISNSQDESSIPNKSPDIVLQTRLPKKLNKKLISQDFTISLGGKNLYEYQIIQNTTAGLKAALDTIKNALGVPNSKEEPMQKRQRIDHKMDAIVSLTYSSALKKGPSGNMAPSQATTDPLLSSTSTQDGTKCNGPSSDVAGASRVQGQLNLIGPPQILADTPTLRRQRYHIRAEIFSNLQEMIQEIINFSCPKISSQYNCWARSHIALGIPDLEDGEFFWINISYQEILSLGVVDQILDKISCVIQRNKQLTVKNEIQLDIEQVFNMHGSSITPSTFNLNNGRIIRWHLSHGDRGSGYIAIQLLREIYLENCKPCNKSLARMTNHAHDLADECNLDFDGHIGHDELLVLERHLGVRFVVFGHGYNNEFQFMYKTPDRDTRKIVLFLAFSGNSFYPVTQPTHMFTLVERQRMRKLGFCTGCLVFEKNIAMHKKKVCQYRSSS